MRYKKLFFIVMSPIYYILGLGLLEIIPEISAVHLKSQSELEETLKREKLKMGCEKEIKVRFVPDGVLPYSKKLPLGDAYIIGINHTGLFGLGNSSTLRHEVRHIHNGDLNRPYNFFLYFSWQEPRVAAYEFRAMFEDGGAE